MKEREGAGEKERLEAGAVVRGLFQPLMLSLLAGVFVFLFLGLATLNARRLETTLVQVQVNKAASIVEGVERLSKELVTSLDRMGEVYQALSPGDPFTDASMSAHEALASAIIEVARDLDAAQEEGRLEPKELSDQARELNLQSVAFLDGEGEIVQSSGPLGSEVLADAKRLLESGESVSLRLLPEKAGSEFSPFVAMRRRGLPGVVLVVLDQERLRTWRTKVSIQEGIEAAGWRKGVMYMLVRDPKGGILAQAGETPQTDVDQGEYSPSRDVAGRGSLIRRKVVSGAKVLEIELPFRMGDKPLGEVLVGLDASEMDELLGRNRLQIYLSTGMMTLLALLAVAFLYNTQSRHHLRLQEMSERLHKAERLSALGRLAEVVAHEVRNPLNAISMAVQRIGREYAPQQGASREEFSVITKVIREEVRRINRIIEEFLGLARKGDLNIQEVLAGELLDRVRILIEPEAASRSIRVLVSEHGEAATVLVDKDRIMQALLNLVTNAVEAVVPGGGTVTLGCRRQGKDRVLMEISDTGTGIPREEIQRIFDAGYTTKGKGLGLGLHIAREIIQLHGGEITVRSEPREGTTFSISLPGRWGARLREGGAS